MRYSIGENGCGRILMGGGGGVTLAVRKEGGSGVGEGSGGSDGG